MTALIIVCVVFLACFVAMLIVYHHAMPYDPRWDEWERRKTNKKSPD